MTPCDYLVGIISFAFGIVAGVLTYRSGFRDGRKRQAQDEARYRDTET